LEKGIEKTYTQFKQRVEQGRSLDPEVVENLAQGRVWTGKQALELGLVDRLGGLEDAIAEAAVHAGIETYNTLEYPKFEESLESMLKGISPSIELQNPIENWIPKDILLSFKNFKTKTPSPYIQTLMPFELKIH
jgi:protease-4